MECKFVVYQHIKVANKKGVIEHNIGKIMIIV